MKVSPDNITLVACYTPDRILVTDLNGIVAVLVDDPGAELMNRPTNVALHEGWVYYANLSGWHIGSFAYDADPMPLWYPHLGRE